MTRLAERDNSPMQAVAAGSKSVGPSSAWPRHEPDEIAAVMQVLQSGRVNALIHGEHNRAFEEEFSDFIGMPHAIAVSNGTVSIEVALRALGIGAGDEVIIPARSFFATASAVVAVGADPVFADVEIQSQNIDPVSVRRLVSERTKAVICVHLAGRPCNMDILMDICASYRLLLIEDCAQAHGAIYGNRRVGSFGDASSFSFCTDKIMSTGGEGGMVMFRDEAVWTRAWSLKDHGKTPPELLPRTISRAGEFQYLHNSFGSNYRLTEMQAAIGRVQLEKLPLWLERRRANAEALATMISDIPGVVIDWHEAHVRPAWYKFYARIDSKAGMTRSDVIAGLMEFGIVCGSGSCPDMSREGAFDTRKVRRDRELANARRLGDQTIMFPVDHLLGEHDMRRVAVALREVMSR